MSLAFAFSGGFDFRTNVRIFCILKNLRGEGVVCIQIKGFRWCAGSLSRKETFLGLVFRLSWKAYFEKLFLSFTIA